MKALKHWISGRCAEIFRPEKPTGHSHSGRPATMNPLNHVVEKLARPGDLTDADLRKLVGYVHLELYNMRAYGQALFQKNETDALAREAMGKIRNIVTERKFHPYADGPLSHIVSYPRSGNTLATVIAQLGPVQILSNINGAVNYIPTECFPSAYPLERIVKAHSIPDYSRRCKYVYLVRDGRDLLPSVAHMSLGSGPKAHNFTKKHELKEFIDWQLQVYPFGDWVSFTRKMLELASRDNVLIERYEELVKTHRDVPSD